MQAPSPRQRADLPDASADATSEPLVIPVIGEELQVGTVKETTGTVRVRKVVHEVSQPLDAPGWREVVETVRVPLNQLVHAPQEPRQQGDVLVIPVYEERLVRQLVLLEEIHVSRRREPLEDSAASASLRREEVIVERLDPRTGQWVPEGA